MKKKQYTPPTALSMELAAENLLATSPGEMGVKLDDENNISSESGFLSGSRNNGSHPIWKEWVPQETRLTHRHGGTEQKTDTPPRRNRKWPEDSHELTISEKIWQSILEFVAAIIKHFSIDDEEVLDALVNESDELAHICELYQCKMAR